jgi:phospholipase C
VPTIIISPWTRGGFVCSQVFDHTSIIRFLETWTGVYEPNISAWRRQVCGDLTSAFDFAHPDTNYPSLPSVTSITCTGGVYLPVPSPQVFPTQEPGTRPARPLPYQPDANVSVECPLGPLWLTVTNAGCASVHLDIYANAYRTDGPWFYDIPACTSQRLIFGTQTNTGGLYDFTCYGPNGFQRRFAGKSQTNCSLLEVSSSIDPTAGGIQLTMSNATGASATFTVSNGYAGAGPWTYSVPANQIATDTYFVVTNNSGWYDLTVTVDTDPAFLRRLAGHIEPVPTYPPHPGPPLLAATISGASLIFSYPAAAGAYTLESTPDLFSTNWTPVTVSSNVQCGSTLLTLPCPAGPAYFRLRQ